MYIFQGTIVLAVYRTIQNFGDFTREGIWWIIYWRIVVSYCIFGESKSFCQISQNFSYRTVSSTGLLLILDAKKHYSLSRVVNLYANT